jgi:hypothetical protein
MGRIADTRGHVSRLHLVSPSLSRLFRHPIHPSQCWHSRVSRHDLHPHRRYLLSFCRCMTGAFGNPGLTAFVNSTAKTFWDKVLGIYTLIAHLNIISSNVWRWYRRSCEPARHARTRGRRGSSASSAMSPENVAGADRVEKQRGCAPGPKQAREVREQ